VKRLLFAPETMNLAETTRTLRIAEACANRFEVVFSSYGGQFERLISRAGFHVVALRPQLTAWKVDHLNRVSKGEGLAQAFSECEIEQRIDGELALYASFNPDAVVTGYCVSVPLSGRIAGLPLVWVSQTTWLKEFYTSGAIVGDKVKSPFLAAVIGRTMAGILSWHSNKVFLNLANRVLRKRGATPFRDAFAFWRGAHNLLAEPPGFSPLSAVPPRHHFIGPLMANQFTDVTDEILRLPRDLPIVYFAMGSVGTPSIVARLLAAFEGRPYRVISPTKDLLSGYPVHVPPNVTVTGWLPAEEVNRMADVAVIHGGIGTVMTAAWAGKPAVGIGMQFEQDGNLSCLVRKGCAIRFFKFGLRAEAAMAAIDRLLADGLAQQKASDLRRTLEPWQNAPERAADYLSSVL
jgi:UDP:flavonoid glycosyltransferase YjiC (YdhE family)